MAGIMLLCFVSRSLLRVLTEALGLTCYAKALVHTAQLMVCICKLLDDHLQ